MPSLRSRRLLGSSVALLTLVPASPTPTPSCVTRRISRATSRSSAARWRPSARREASSPSARRSRAPARPTSTTPRPTPRPGPDRQRDDHPDAGAHVGDAGDARGREGQVRAPVLGRAQDGRSGRQDRNARLGRGAGREGHRGRQLGHPVRLRVAPGLVSLPGVRRRDEVREHVGRRRLPRDRRGGDSSLAGVDVDRAFSAWTMVVSTKKPGDLLRNLALFDGFTSIDSDAGHAERVRHALGLPVLALGFDANMAAFAYEGDNAYDGDRFTINGTEVSNAQNPGRLFNSSRSYLGAPFSGSADVPLITGEPAPWPATTSTPSTSRRSWPRATRRPRSAPTPATTSSCSAASSPRSRTSRPTSAR